MYIVIKLIFFVRRFDEIFKMKSENDDSGDPNSSLSQNGSEYSSRKRKCSSSNDDKASKIPKTIQSTSNEETERKPDCSNLNLLSLSDDVLLIIMSHLKAVDLMSLRK